MILDFSLAFIFLGKTVYKLGGMVFAAIQMTLSPVKSMADVMWNFKREQRAGQIIFELQLLFLIDACPALSHHISRAEQHRLGVT